MSKQCSAALMTRTLIRLDKRTAENLTPQAWLLMGVPIEYRPRQSASNAISAMWMLWS
jgi:hypothetical protein